MSEQDEALEFPLNSPSLYKDHRCAKCGGFEFMDRPHSDVGCPSQRSGREDEAYSAGRLAGFEEGSAVSDEILWTGREAAAAYHRAKAHLGDWSDCDASSCSRRRSVLGKA